MLIVNSQDLANSCILACHLQIYRSKKIKCNGLFFFFLKKEGYEFHSYEAQST